MKGEVIGYARVSTQGQDLSEQISILKKAGCTRIYKEKFTGTTTHRPQFEKMLKFVRDGDVVIVTKLDRLARTARDALNIAYKLNNEGVTLRILDGSMTFDNSTQGQLMFNIMSAFAQFERDMIVSRMQEGKAYAKAHNADFKEGRPPIPQDRLQEAYKMHDEQHIPWRKVAYITGIGLTTLVTKHKQQEMEEKTNETN